SSYCVLENNENMNDCYWVEGSLPKLYLSELGDGVKVLTIWLRNASNRISKPITTNGFIVDTTSPSWNSANITHASFHNSLSESPAISFEATASDLLTTLRY